MALLLVLGGLVYLYVSPARSYLATFRDAREKREEVRRLQREHDRLLQRRRALERPSVIELEARKLGMIRPGERPYVITGLPRG